jgi:hypothetical protein
LRELIYLANDYTHNGEPSIVRTEVDAQIEDVKRRALMSEPAEFKILNQEMTKLNEYLEIIDGVDETNFNANQVYLEYIEEKEIQRAEMKAVLAAHYTKLRKYYGDDHLKKYMKDNLQFEDMNSGRKIYQPPYKVRNNQLTLRSKSNKPTDSIAVKLEELNEVKKNQPSHYYQREFDPTELKELEQARRVKKYVQKPMMKFEEVTDMYLMKMHDELQKKDHRVLTMEEKMSKYVQDFKESASKRKDLKARTEKHIREGRKNIDEFLEQQAIDIEKRSDQKYLFKQYVKLLYENKI